MTTDLSPAEARLSPDGRNVAIRRGDNDWRVSNGGHYRDVHVADWLPLAIAVLAPAPDSGGEAWACARCGLASYEHGDPDSPAFRCIYTPAPAPPTFTPGCGDGDPS